MSLLKVRKLQRSATALARRALGTSHTVSSNTSNEEFDLAKLDGKWSSKWRSISPGGSIYPLSKKPVDAQNNKKYIMSQFPYPSGVLHMGHLRVYTISDVLARFHRAQGTTVLHPMGWDAFGLPAENAAIERNVNPGVWTRQNITKMKEQTALMMADFDWDREVTTCEQDYYKWTQKIFLLLYEEGLAYRKEAEINWDPIDQTVLANEQVDSEGRSWRSGAIAEKKLLNQWFLGITEFASDLNKDLELLNEWPTKVKLMQKHWIGESHGAEIRFKTNEKDFDLTVYTTRPDTIFSVQYIALAIDDKYVLKLAETNDKLKNFIEKAKNLPQDSKEGFELPSIKAQNPLANKKFDIPLFVAPYVLGSYGHGVVMGCPGHDQRDYEFWIENKKDSPILKSVDPVDGQQTEGPFTKQGILNSTAQEFAGLNSEQAKFSIIEKLSTLGLGKKSTQFRIRDWLISRQRYWGAPIPIIHCDSCGTVPVPDRDLPVLLPEDAKIVGKGNPLEHLKSFHETKCPSCGSKARRDTDTMDTFMDSSWYFFRYTDPQNDKEPFNYKFATDSMPVDIYVGGVEHAILHLLYSRFISKFLSKKGLWDGSEINGEPFKKLITQGMVHGKTYSNPANGRFLKPEELDYSNPAEPKVKSTGERPLISYEKMSKSKYNGADPTDCIKLHGADATRAHILFQAPVNDVLDWDESKIVGIERWLRRVLQFTSELPKSINETSASKPKLSDFNQFEVEFHNNTESILQNITNSFAETISLNTVISDYMKFFKLVSTAFENDLIHKRLILEKFEKLLISMSPVTPITSEESWEILKTGLNIKWETIFASKWPQVEKIIESNVTKYNVFINGKMRFTFNGDLELYKNEDKIKELIVNSEDGVKYLQNKSIKKIIGKSNTISFVLNK
ncbi:hypothetical protein WICMUC_001053 [Wickerhamomyces mucosus]|uniref:leucine--tRNA ligase n=1 Tax=Wickerhamomyces mucosus TaxID=1378264 RepID=A0A9P8PWC8_9ASCO|nr:hypothetical protein WICMUC_001053 [Wickerhamomyces mucosus]